MIFILRISLEVFEIKPASFSLGQASSETVSRSNSDEKKPSSPNHNVLYFLTRWVPLEAISIIDNALHSPLDGSRLAKKLARDLIRIGAWEAVSLR